MKTNNQDKRYFRKRRTSRLVVFLFVVYALADASILQIYCGNETVGIPPAHHSSFVRSTDKADPDDSAKMQQSDDQRLPADQDPDRSCSDECLGCCSHMMAGFFFFEPASFEYSLEYSVSATYENKYSNFNLSYLFRPPRTS